MGMYMSYDLVNPSMAAHTKFSRESLGMILHLARFYGWQPLGTRPPLLHLLRDLSLEDWDGTYLRNEGQVVEAEDALSMAVALEMALDDIPDVNLEVEQGLEPLAEEDDQPEWLSPAEKAMVQAGLEDQQFELVGVLPFEFFAGDEKQHLAEFISFCRLGGFTIT